MAQLKINDTDVSEAVADVQIEPAKPDTIWDAIARLRDPTPSLADQITLSYLYRIHDKEMKMVHQRLGFTEEECPRCQSFGAKMRTLSKRIADAFDPGQLAEMARQMAGGS